MNMLYYFISFFFTGVTSNSVKVKVKYKITEISNIYTHFPKPIMMLGHLLNTQGKQHIFSFASTTSVLCM